VVKGVFIPAGIDRFAGGDVAPRMMKDPTMKKLTKLALTMAAFAAAPALAHHTDLPASETAETHGSADCVTTTASGTNTQTTVCH